MTAESEKKKSNESHHPMGILLSAYTQRGGGRKGGRKDERFAAARTRTLTATRVSSPYITMKADWPEKPFPFITVLQTATACSGSCQYSGPALLAAAAPVS